MQHEDWLDAGLDRVVMISRGTFAEAPKDRTRDWKSSPLTSRPVNLESERFHLTFEADVV